MDRATDYQRAFLATSAFVAVSLLLVSVTVFLDPIDKLAFSLSVQTMESGGMWRNGFWTLVDLPASAKPEDVLQKYFTPPFGVTAPYTVIELKKIHIVGPEISTYFAALVETKHGRKIVLFNYGTPNWSGREYDPK